jgi:hypothetical protein
MKFRMNAKFSINKEECKESRNIIEDVMISNPGL